MQTSMGRAGAGAQAAIHPYNKLADNMQRGHMTMRDLHTVATQGQRIWEHNNRMLASNAEITYDAAGNARVFSRDMASVNVNTMTAGQQLMQFNGALQVGAANLVKWGKNMQWAGRQLTVGFTVPLMLVGRLAANAAESFDKEMTRILKVHTLTAQEGTKLWNMQSDAIMQQTNRIVDLGAEMGFTADETASATAEFAQMGYEGRSLEVLSDSALRLSRTTGTDLNTSIEASRILAQAFNIELEDLNENFARLNIVENNTALSVEDSVLGLPVVAAVANTVGLEIHEVNGLMALMKNAGISAKEGATALRTGLLQLVQKATPQAIEAFEQANINLEEMIATMNRGANGREAGDVLIFFEEMAKHVDAAAGNQVQLNRLAAGMSKLMGVRQTGRVLTFLTELTEAFEEGTDASRAFLGVTADSEEVLAIYDAEFRRIQESAAGVAETLRAQINVEMARLGETFLEVANKIRGFVVEFLRWFNGLDDGIKKIILATTGFIAVLGPVIMLAGLFANAAGQLLSMFTKLFPSMGLVTGQAAAEAKAFDSTTAATVRYARSLDTATAAQGRYIKGSAGVVAANTNQARSAGGAAAGAAGGPVSKGARAGATAAAGGAAARVATESIDDAGKAAGRAGTKLGVLLTTFKFMGAAIAAVLSPLGMLVTAIVAFVSLPIIANPGEFMRGFKETFAASFETVANSVQRLRDRWAEFTDRFRSDTGETSQGLAKIAHALGFILGILASIAGFVTARVVDGFSTLVDIIDIIVTGVEYLWTSIELIGQAIMGLISGDWEGAEEAFARLEELGENLMAKLQTLLISMVSNAMRTIGDALSDLPVIGNKLRDAFHKGADALDRYAPSISSASKELNAFYDLQNENNKNQDAFNDALVESKDYVEQLAEAGVDINDYTEEEIRNHELLNDEMRANILTAIRRAEIETEIAEIIAEQKRIQAEDPEDRPRIGTGLPDHFTGLDGVERASSRLVRLEEKRGELQEEALSYHAEVLESMGYEAEAAALMEEGAEGMNDELDEAEEHMRELSSLADRFASTIRSEVAQSMSDVATAITEEFQAEREAAMNAFGTRMDNIREEFSARSEAMSERINEEKEAFKEAHDLRMEQVKIRHESEMTRFEDRRQAERDAIEETANARVEALEDAQEVEDDAERQRERAFEREKARINYLHGMRTGNIDMQLALARGELSTAAIMREQLGTDTAQFHADSTARERGWALDDRKRARDEEIGMIRDVTKERLEAFDEETKAQQTALETQQKQTIKALEAQNKAQEKALTARHKMMQRNLEQEQEIAEKRVETEKKAAEAGFDARERMMKRTIDEWQRTNATNAKDYEEHLETLRVDLKNHAGIDGGKWTNIVERYSKNTGNQIHKGFNSGINRAKQSMGEDAKWEKFGKTMMADLGNGVSTGINKAFRELAELFGIELPEPSSDDVDYGKSTATSRTGGQAGLWHSGGNVHGSSAPGLKPDEVPAVLQKGEYVIQRDAAKTVGGSFLDEINNAHKMRQMEKRDRYHTGGEVDFTQRLKDKSTPRGVGGLFGRYLSYLADHGAMPGMGAMGTGNLEHLPNLVPPDQGATHRYSDWRTGVNAKVVGITSAILNSIPGGQVITSAFRPGAITTSGNPSQHGAGMAVDIGARARREGGSPSSEREGDAIAAAFRNHPNVGQVLWKTMTGGNHYDHVHAGFKFHDGGLVEEQPDWSKMTFGDTLQRGIMSTLMGGMFNTMADGMLNAVPGMDMFGDLPDTSGPIKQYARGLLSNFGWGDNQWAPLHNIVQRESSWNPNAQNPTSTAYGLFQFLNSTWAGVNAQKTNDPYAQTRAGFQYIKDRYGSPAGAWDFWQKNHWYHSGGEVKIPQLAKGGHVNYDNTLANLHKGERVLTSDLSSKLDDGINRMATGDSFGDTVVQIENFHGTEENIEKLATRLEQIHEKRSLQRGAKRRFG